MTERPTATGGQTAGENKSDHSAVTVRRRLQIVSWLQQLQIVFTSFTVVRAPSISKMTIMFLQRADRRRDQYQ